MGPVVPTPPDHHETRIKNTKHVTGSLNVRETIQTASLEVHLSYDLNCPAHGGGGTSAGEEACLLWESSLRSHWFL